MHIFFNQLRSLKIPKSQRWLQISSCMILATTMGVPMSSEAEDVTQTAAGYSESGDPTATLSQQVPVSTSRVAISRKPDDAKTGESAVTLPKVKVGKSVAGGDVGDVVADQLVEIRPAWERLEALSPDDKANAVIQVEVGNDVSASKAEAIKNAEDLWNIGVFTQAIDAIRSMEESETDIAVGISWKTPKAVDSPDWANSDVRIGARTEIKETHLDFDAQNRNQFAVLRYTDGSTTDWYWSVNFSTDKGKTWQETYTWFASYEIKDVSAAVVDDYLWVGYVGGISFDQGRMRRFNVNDGSVDDGYDWDTIIDKNTPINEIAVVTNADDFDNRVYYYALLDQPAPLDTAEATETSATANSEANETIQQEPTDMGDVEVLTPMMPGSFDGDVRNLPKAPAPPPGPPVEIPEGQIPDGTGDGWDKKTDGESPVDADTTPVDPVLDTGDFAYGDAFTPNVNFEGMGYTSVAPPDTVGDVGPNHYIQMINHSSGSQFQIWNKSGMSLAGPTVLTSLWTAGGNCTSGLGDPIVVYDPLADRWLMSEFADTGNHLCIYVSKTADPVTGGWWLYDFATPAFPDYPKYGVWPDAYYVSTYEGATLGVYALDRTNMLKGAAATSQRFSISSLTPSTGTGCTNARNTRILPGDLDGTAPPYGSPSYFFRSVEHCQDVSNPTDRLEVFEFDVNWTTPSNSSFTLVSTLTPANFSLVPCTPGIRDCIPQRGTTVKLDALSNRPLHRLQYRNFGGYETLVTNQAVDAGSSVSGTRWYELRRDRKSVV